MATEATQHVAMSLADHLPMLQVLVPFVAAPLIVVLGSRRLAWPLAFASSLAAFVIAILLLMRVIDGTVLSYHIGGWEPPLDRVPDRRGQCLCPAACHRHQHGRASVCLQEHRQ